MNGGWKPTRAAVAALALAACGALAVPAAAEKGNYHVRPTLKVKRTAEQDTFTGKLESRARPCEANRKVKMLHRSVKQTSKWEVVATLRTNGQSKWKFVPKKNQNGLRQATPGNWHVKVGETRANFGGREITCKEKFSSSVLVP
jgi:hypothetical protein